jgi:hypothetical protein
MVVLTEHECWINIWGVKLFEFVGLYKEQIERSLYE